jgi:membrane-bound lytic murein transglycosylase D
LLSVDLNWKRILPIFILFLVLAGNEGRTENLAGSDNFPLYTCIQPNVDFWLKIYTQYSSDQGVIHDKRRLERIYGVIPLEDPYRGGRKINERRIKAAKRKYKGILTRLMQGKPPAGLEEIRVAEQFGPNAKSGDYRAALRNLRCQTGQKDRFREGLIRSGAYIDEIKRIFTAAGLPEELAYLPHVESSFNPKAYSKFGAAGMWQFTRSTGRRFMTVGYTIDERRDPILSSHAAAKLLRDNYRKLNNWPLAITAYNHGITGTRRAVRKKGGYERIFKEYRSRSFRFASRNFYSEFLAAREAARNYRQYFGELKLSAPPKTHAVEMIGYVSLPELSLFLKVDLDELRELNPALRAPVYRGQKYVPKGYHLRLPHRDEHNWERLMAQLPQNIIRSKQKRSMIYTVQSGDTAGKIAKIHGVNLKELIAVNSLDRRATIYVNQKLRIPLPKDKSVLVAKRTREDNRPVPRAVPKSKSIALKDNVNVVARENPTAIPGVDSAAASPPAAASSGVTAAKAAATAAEIEPSFNRPQANQMAVFLSAHQIFTTDLQPIQEIEDNTDENAIDLSPDQPGALLPTLQANKPAVPVSEEMLSHPQIMQGHFAVNRTSKHGGKNIGYIQVEAEETLGHYAEWLKVAASEIRRLNGFPYGRPLQLNQQIKIPLRRVSKEEFEEKRFEFHQELAEDFFATYRVEKVRTYFIKKGDNIWNLARREFDIPLWLIKRYNAEVDFGALMPTQKLLIPVVAKDA